jgi:ParB family chromosome partitioning protein
VARRSGLGKGLSALIPDAGPQAGTELRELAVSSIKANEYQPRTAFDEEALETLTASITELGVLQPVLVRPVGDHFELVAGERRWRAAQAAGLETIPAIVRLVDDPLSLAQALVENLQREDLNAIEEAAAYQQLSQQFGLDAEAIATRVGKSRPAVANTLRLLQLPLSIQSMVRDRRLSAGHARALLGLDDDAARERLAQRAIDEQLSVRALERAVKEQQAAPPAAPRPRPVRRERSASVLEVEERLSERFATRVDVQVGAKDRGKIVIEFSGLDDLSRLYEVLIAGEGAAAGDA